MPSPAFLRRRRSEPGPCAAPDAGAHPLGATESASTPDTRHRWDPFASLSDGSLRTGRGADGLASDLHDEPLVERIEARRNSREFAAACAFLLDLARVPAWPTTREDRARLLRRVRSRAHPDVNGGERALWDRVEHAVAVTGLAT